MLEADRATTSAAAGSYELADVPAGRRTLAATRIGYEPATRNLPLQGTIELDLILKIAPFNVEAITATATRAPLISDRSPLPAAALSGEALRQNLGVSLAHLVDQPSGVHTLSTGEEIGKTVIRGLTGSRVLVLDYGHRLEDYFRSDEDGPSVDPRGRSASS